MSFYQRDGYRTMDIIQLFPYIFLMEQETIASDLSDGIPHSCNIKGYANAFKVGIGFITVINCRGRHCVFFVLSKKRYKQNSVKTFCKIWKSYSNYPRDIGSRMFLVLNFLYCRLYLFKLLIHFVFANTLCNEKHVYKLNRVSNTS